MRRGLAAGGVYSRVSLAGKFFLFNNMQHSGHARGDGIH